MIILQRLQIRTRAVYHHLLRMCNLSGSVVPVQEVQFPVPWGHIAGKAWGDPAGRPVLALHGWLDNAGSFDKLVPLLSKDLHVVAIDWPGHGLSSHRPRGAWYHLSDYIADIKYVVDALKWDKFSLLAHSMGVGAATWFAGALPDRVDAMVLLEGIGFWSANEGEVPSRMGRALNMLPTSMERDIKSYPTWDAVVDRVLEGHQGLGNTGFDREAAATLAIRGTRQTEDGRYQFTRDLRLRMSSLVRVSHGVNHAFLKAVQCPVLVIMAEDSYVSFSEVSSRLAILDKEKVKVVKVAGGHHVHLCQPEVMDKLVGQFLLTRTISLSKL